MRYIKVFFVYFIAFFVLLNSCAPNIIPIQSKNVIIKDKFSLVKKKEFDIAIQAQSWNEQPDNLENYFTVFYIIFRNNTREQINLKKDSFVLIDENGEQYNLFDCKEVTKIIYGDNQFYDLNYIIDFESKDKDEIKEEYENRLNGMRNIMLKSFNFSDIRPQAQQSGYIFFEKIRFKKRLFFKIYYNDVSIPFLISN
ncbi:MAG: hypothetical protein H8D22_05425 [Candidatus Cloacimonetes bacterium]|nr:hypothetical protein [Candidatus Cloacimonadota bacterium]